MATTTDQDTTTTDTSSATDTTATDTTSTTGASTQSASGSATDSSGQSSDSSGSTDSSQQPDQTPAADLVADAGDPAQVAADPSAASSSGAQTADTTSGDAVAAAEGAGVKELVELGKFAADIMKDSAPDYSMKSDPVSVMPKDSAPLDLTGFSSDPHELKVHPVFRNKIGMLMADLPLVVQWHYGGRYKGHGLYINNGSIFIDTGADVGAFYKVNIHATLQGPANAGTETDPVATLDAHIEINITDKISPAFQMLVYEGQIRGDGSGELKARS
jgi:hypothetical protein